MAMTATENQQRMRVWMDAIDSALGSLNDATANKGVLDNGGDSLTEHLVNADKVRLGQWIEQIERYTTANDAHPERFKTAWHDAYQKDADGVRFGVFYWMLYTRWLTIHRMYCPERFEELRLILHEARRCP